MKERKLYGGIESGRGNREGWRVRAIRIYYAHFSNKLFKNQQKGENSHCVLMGFPKLRTLKQEKYKKLVSMLALPGADANTTA